MQLTGSSQLKATGNETPQRLLEMVAACDMYMNLAAWWKGVPMMVQMFNFLPKLCGEQKGNLCSYGVACTLLAL